MRPRRRRRQLYKQQMIRVVMMMHIIKNNKLSTEYKRKSGDFCGDFVVVVVMSVDDTFLVCTVEFLGPNGIANVAVVIRENVCGSGLTTVAALGFADVFFVVSCCSTNISVNIGTVDTECSACSLMFEAV